MNRRLWPWAILVGCAATALVGWALTSRTHLPLRVARIDGEWFIERCGRPEPRVFQCVADADLITQLDVDENGDGEADVRSFDWDGARPRECEEWLSGRWQPLPIPACCCRVRCSDRDMVAFGCPR